MSAIKEIFINQQIDEQRLKQVEALTEPATKYIIAVTPRSGSSYLCDVLRNAEVFGKPDEVLPQEFIPDILQRVPAKTPDAYLQNILKVRQSANGVSGLKTSWYQFFTFCGNLEELVHLRQYKFIYLTRKDIAAQAVSMYAAVESSVFHTNITHEKHAIEKLKTLEYDFEKIDYWHRHITAQEEGWTRFFSNDITPLRITYEEIHEDVAAVCKRVATFLGVSDPRINTIHNHSIFNKLGDDRNIQWARRYISEANERRD